MIDGEGNMIWERDYTEELKQYWILSTGKSFEDLYFSPGADAVASSCDGGFTLIQWGYGGDNMLWRIDAEGRIIWATQLINLDTDLYNWWMSQVEFIEFSAERIIFEEDGEFVLVGNFALEAVSPGGSPFAPYVLKFRDPDLEGVICDYCQDLFPQLWDTVNAKLPTAKAIIDEAKRKGTDTTIIQLMEQELQNAENAQKICNLKSAMVHLDWIIQAAPELYPLTAILLMPIWWAWKQTSRYN
jgi:hypothetical protein